MTSFAFALKAVHRFRSEELTKLSEYMGYRPIEVVRKTIQATTQLAKSMFSMNRHYASRFPQLWRYNIQEVVCMDDFHGKHRAHGGLEYAAVFYGNTSKMINVYGMKKKSDVPKAYLDFLREEGIPGRLHRDKAKQNESEQLDEINRKYNVKDSFSEPYCPWQNPVETHAIRWLVKATSALLARQGAPDFLWLYAMKYMALVNNWCAHEALDWQTPFEKRHGKTPDISALLVCRFYERVYYADHNVSFPKTQEKAGYWIGVAENVGDALCYYVLTDDTHAVITTGYVRPVSQSRLNKKVSFDPTLESNVVSEPLDSSTPMAAHEPDLLAPPKVSHCDEDAPDMHLPAIKHIFDRQRKILARQEKLRRSKTRRATTDHRPTTNRRPTTKPSRATTPRTTQSKGSVTRPPLAKKTKGRRALFDGLDIPRVTSIPHQSRGGTDNEKLCDIACLVFLKTTKSCLLKRKLSKRGLLKQLNPLVRKLLARQGHQMIEYGRPPVKLQSRHWPIPLPGQKHVRQHQDERQYDLLKNRRSKPQRMLQRVSPGSRDRSMLLELKSGRHLISSPMMGKSSDMTQAPSGIRSSILTAT